MRCYAVTILKFLIFEQGAVQFQCAPANYVTSTVRTTEPHMDRAFIKDVLRGLRCLHCASWKTSSLRTRAGSSGVVPRVQARLRAAPSASPGSHTLYPSRCPREVTPGHLFVHAASFPSPKGPGEPLPAIRPLSQQTWEPQLPPQQRRVDVSARRASAPGQ